MKEMIYQKTWGHSLLDYGTYRGYNYCVISQGVFPCGYVEIPQDHPYRTNHDAHIYCHGAITFHGRLSDDLGLPTNTYWIGWDYGHYGDLCGYEFMFLPYAYGHAYTTQDVIDECYNVINQLEAMR